mgnify:CR=1 FL=1
MTMPTQRMISAAMDVVNARPESGITWHLGLDDRIVIDIYNAMKRAESSIAEPDYVEPENV